ncbi:hypothetical protein [Streptosporangium roseum]|uniref:hypothetical protein n=1 Tax=Streptosporangium roseum TaxID=2001 RepID=UPI0004CD9560|nr:hypothetical protein [Streptosporangium roseum]
MEPVTSTERRLAAYQFAMRITPTPWDVGDVKRQADRIIWFLDRGDKDRGQFELRCSALETQTIALGCGPARFDGRERLPNQDKRSDIADWSDADKLVRAAEKILDYLTRR